MGRRVKRKAPSEASDDNGTVKKVNNRKNVGSSANKKLTQKSDPQKTPKHNVKCYDRLQSVDDDQIAGRNSSSFDGSKTKRSKVAISNVSTRAVKKLPLLQSTKGKVHEKSSSSCASDVGDIVAKASPKLKQGKSNKVETKKLLDSGRTVKTKRKTSKNETLSCDELQKKRVKSEANSLPDRKIPAQNSKSEVTHDVDSSSSSDSDWEEVEEGEEIQDIDEYKPDIPKEGVEITLETPKLYRKREKKEFDMQAYIRCQINRRKKYVQLAVHQVHLLCLLARGFYVNNVLNSDDVTALALSLIPPEFLSLNIKVTKFGIEYIQKAVDWFRSCFAVDPSFKPSGSFEKMVSKCFQYKKASSASQYNIIFTSIARTMGLNVRLCISFYPITFKPSDLLKKEKPKKDAQYNNTQVQINNEGENTDSPASVSKSSTKSDKSVKTASKSKKANSILKKQKNVNRQEKVPEVSTLSSGRRQSRRSLKKATYKLNSDESDNSDDDDDDFQDVDDSDVSSNDEKKKPVQKKRASQCTTKMTKFTKNRKILSSDSSPERNESTETGVECWAEIYSKSDQRWISVECFNNILNRPHAIEKHATQPVSYVLAFDNLSFVKDVTKRYCSQWMTHTRKLRVEPEWWQEAILSFLPPATKEDRDEDSKMEAALLRKPIPTSISELKSHPLYALKRHLLKFEAIYPSDAPPVGFVRGEPVYARECVHKLHSRETWLKEARLVRIGEEPYKIVKARPKWDKMAGVFRTDLPLNLYGLWQTEEYMPPIAWNGKVPRNEYGNVELFKPCMLPVGTVHLRNPGLNRVANKLGIDCSPAVVGFDGHRGTVHPVFDGFVVCEEFKDTLLAAWEEEQENIRKREEEKREKRVYGNWKKLIKGLLIREKIRLKYSVK